MNRFINKKIFLFILILFISIGFAYLSTSLNIAGLIGYKGNSWNIYFDNVQVLINDTESDTPTINNSLDTVNFSVSFSEPSELFRFSVDVINDGTIDAMLGELIRTGINASNEDYIDYTVTYPNGDNVLVNDLLSSGTKARIIVSVEYKNTTERIAPAGTNNYSISLKYVVAKGNTREVDSYYESESNNIFVLNNAKANTLSNLKIYGKTEQTQYEGYQLLKKDGLSTSLTDSDYWLNIGGGRGTITPLTDGWLHVEGDNTTGTSATYVNFFLKKEAVDLEPNTDYTLIVDYRNYEGTGNICLTQFNMWSVEPFSSGTDNGSILAAELNENKNGSKKILVHTKNDLTNTYALRSWVGISGGYTVSLDVRITIMKGNHVNENYVWEPYVDEIPSPNPHYPQDINSVTGNLYLKINNKNYFNGSFVGRYFCYNLPAGAAGTYITINSQDANNVNFTINKNDWLYVLSNTIELIPNQDYTISFVFNSTKEDNTLFFIYSINSSNQYIELSHTNSETGNRHYTFNSGTTGKVAFGWGGYNTFLGQTLDVSNIQIEKGEVATEYVENVNKNYTIALGDIELFGIDNYRDYIYYKDNEWYIHRMTELYTFNENNSWQMNYGASYFHCSYSRGDKALPYTKGFSNYFIFDSRTSGIVPSFSSQPISNGIYCLQPQYFAIFVRNTDYSNVTDFKNWISSHNIKVLFPLSEESDEKITDISLINQLNNLIANNLLDGENIININSNDGLVPDIKFDYVHN